MRKGMAVPITAVGTNWQKPRYLKIEGICPRLCSYCSLVNFSGGVRPSCKAYANSEYLQTFIMMTTETSKVHPP